ncbi:MAG: carbamoyltransferase HypF [Gammaproteobacteria bacterium]|nr:carbamoyltransferase HypF [Gammaproteobacteria bacterium]
MSRGTQRTTPVDRVTYRWKVNGTVQGVGFRPFVFRLAEQHQLKGWVKNQLGRVEILTQGSPENQEAFGQALIQTAPPLANPQLTAREEIVHRNIKGFFIAASDTDSDARISVPTDLYMCEQCRAELDNENDRRYRYPFNNCTQCGPRYTLIEAMPYDRANTSMQEFTLCPACEQEYQSPADRRFHAEPIACSECGPSLIYTAPDSESLIADAALQAALVTLKAGKIVAVKGIGGYHLLCDALNTDAIKRLREKKHRPHKPLAVMFPVTTNDPLGQLRREVELTASEEQLLLSPARPIVLAKRAADSQLPDTNAPGLNEVGVFLPYSPLHQLLLADMGGPLVATSGNISGEPVLTNKGDAAKRLVNIADGFLHHNRRIVRPADDSVYRSLGGAPRPIRLGRGIAPLELPSRYRFPQPVLAVGGHLKNNIALAMDDRIVIAPHIGDMDSLRSLAVFENVVADLPRLYGVEVTALVCDAHPGYQTTRWANTQPLPIHYVWHHHAHASAAYAQDYQQDCLMFTWDGVGLGEDGHLWGGEALLGRPGHWQRVGTWRPFRLPGGDRVARQPWRSAASLSWEIGLEPPWTSSEQSQLKAVWEARVNCPNTSAVGRVFDAAAALLDLVHEASFEGQGPMLLESLAGAEDQHGPHLPCNENGTGLWEIDWGPLLEFLIDQRLTQTQRAAGFHDSLAHALLDQALAIKAQHGVECVGFGGGVFQNRLLVESATRLLEQQGLEVAWSESIPVNDAGLSFGQLLDHAGMQSD